MTGRPAPELVTVDAAFALLASAVAGLTDVDARSPSRLPGWTRGHVLTHIARSGDGDTRTVDGAIAGEVRDKYPGGGEQRERGIAAGADRSIAELRADLDASQDALRAAWAAMPDDAWDRIGRTPSGERTMREVVFTRRREILVHLVDLDIGLVPSDLPEDYVRDDIDWLREMRTRECWPDARW